MACWLAYLDPFIGSLVTAVAALGGIASPAIARPVRWQATDTAAYPSRTESRA